MLKCSQMNMLSCGTKNKWGLVWKKFPKDDVKLAVNMKLVCIVLYSSIAQKKTTSYMSVKHFLSKRLINFRSNHMEMEMKENRGENNVTKKSSFKHRLRLVRPSSLQRFYQELSKINYCNSLLC